MARSNSAIPGGLAGLGQLKELRQRLFFVLVALFVYRVATHIPVPGINPVALAELFNQQRGTILDMFNMFSGGALSRFSVVALGIMPYISASIIMQLLSVVDPKLKQLKKEGEAGRKKNYAIYSVRHSNISDVSSFWCCNCIGGATGNRASSCYGPRYWI